MLDSNGHAQQEDRWPWARAALFRGLGAEELASIAARLAVRAFAPGELLIRQGEHTGALFIIRGGIVQIEIAESEQAGGRAKPLRRLVGGECFGEMSLITGTEPTASARALTAGEVWTLGQADFLQLAMSQPQFSYNITGILSERLSHTSRNQGEAAMPRVVVIVAAWREPWLTLARQVARLSRQATLFLDLGASGDDAPEFGLADVLGGRLRPGGAALTAVRGPSDGDVRAGDYDLPAALGQLERAFHNILIVAPPGHPLLTVGLLTYATRVLVGAALGDIARLRAMLAGLPAWSEVVDHGEVGVVLTDAPPLIAPTATVCATLADDLGVPVRGLIPARVDGRLVAIAAVARWLVGQRIGWVLGAGGAKGFAHVGAVGALRRARVPLDCTAGSSIGAIISAGVALELPTAQIEWALRGGAKRVFRPTLPRHAILSNTVLSRWFRRPDVYGQRRIEDLAIPFAVSATDLTKGQEIVIRHGPVWEAVLASAAIPGLYPASLVQHHWLADGGVVNPVPVSIARLLGADIVVAVDLSVPLAPRQELQEVAPPPPTSRPGLVETILRSRDILMAEIRSHTVGEPAFLIKPEVAGVAMQNFSDGARFIAAGEEAAEAILPRLRELLPWLADPTEAEPTYR